MNLAKSILESSGVITMDLYLFGALFMIWAIREVCSRVPKNFGR